MVGGMTPWGHDAWGDWWEIGYAERMAPQAPLAVLFALRSAAKEPLGLVGRWIEAPAARGYSNKIPCQPPPAS